MPLDVEWARSRFPAIASNDFVFMDNAGGSAVLDTVSDKVSAYLSSTNVQLGASYRVSQESTTLVKLGNEAGQKFVNAEHLDEIVFGSSTTQLVENLARAMEPGLKSGDEIIISNTDHEANVGPFAKLAKRRGLKLKIWEVNKKTLELDLSSLKKLLTKRTRLVAVTHCSNILGTVNNVKEIAKLVHTIPGAEICVDGVAYAPHKAVDVRAWDVDFYVFSWYKVYGPHISMLYTKRKAAARLSSLAHFFIHSDEKPYMFQPGGQNYELSAAVPYILGYISEIGSPEGTVQYNEGENEVARVKNLLDSISRESIEEGYNKISAHENVLATNFLEYLASRKDIYKVIGRPAPGPGRVPTISFLAKGIKSENLVLEVDKQDIGIRFAHRLIVGTLKLDERDGIVRVSLVHYNTEEEVKKLISVLEDIVNKLPAVKSKL
ncbi:hypothetical protein HDU97_007849 [Phlyctochytrium planicorne]|nr:hypothetical protein HDU97_007849 [Phlyctochytrium planicorne]